MTPKAKRTLIAVAFVIGLAAAAWFWLRASPSQVITLPDGRQLQFVGTSFGKRHIQPTLAAQLICRLPAPGNFLRQTYGVRLGQPYQVDTQQPSFAVWFKSFQTNVPTAPLAPVYRAMLADDHDVLMWNSYPVPVAAGVSWPMAIFELLPRRSRDLQLVLVERTSAVGQLPENREVGRIRFPNPLFRNYPQWEPEALPSLKRVADVEAELAGLRIESARSPDGFHPARQGGAVTTKFDVTLKSLRGNRERWTVHLAELSDATGNRIQSELGDSVHRDSLTGTLWPGEAAWRLKLHLKRDDGIPPEDLVTFTNVALLNASATNTIWLTNTLGSFQVIMGEYITDTGLMPARTSAPKFHVKILNALEDVTVDLIRMTANTGANLATSKQRTLQFMWGKVVVVPVVYPALVPSNVTTVDITWAVQKTRAVEFYVKPPKMK